MSSETAKARYQYYKSHGICVSCGQRDAEKGIYCFQCWAAREESRIKTDKNYKYYMANKEKLNIKSRKRNKEIYWQRKENNLCVRCGKHPRSKGHTKCEYCLAKQRQYQTEYRRRQNITPKVILTDGHHCVRCGSTELYSEKLCKNCYDRSIKALEKAREKTSTQNHIWRAYDRELFKNATN